MILKMRRRSFFLNEALEEVEEGPDEGETLIIRRLLVALLHQMSLNKE